jgi:hypothetical protein
LCLRFTRRCPMRTLAMVALVGLIAVVGSPAYGDLK